MYFLIIIRLISRVKSLYILCCASVFIINPLFLNFLPFIYFLPRILGYPRLLWFFSGILYFSTVVFSASLLSDSQFICRQFSVISSSAMLFNPIVSSFYLWWLLLLFFRYHLLGLIVRLWMLCRWFSLVSAISSALCVWPVPSFNICVLDVFHLFVINMLSS